MAAPSMSWNRTYVYGFSGATPLETPITPVATSIITSTSGTYSTNSVSSYFGFSPSTTGTYGGRVNFTSTRDLSAYPYMGIQMSHDSFPYPNSPATLCDTFANGGISIVWFDSSANWSEFHLWGSEYTTVNLEDGGWAPYRSIAVPGCYQGTLEKTRTPDNSSGTLDWANIDGFEFIFRATSTHGGTVNLYVGAITLFDDPEFADGQPGNELDFDYISTQIRNPNNNFHPPDIYKNPAGNFVGGIGDIYEPRFAVSIGDGSTLTYFRDAGSTLTPYPIEGTGIETQSALLLAGVDRGVDINQSATCDVVFDGTVFAAPDYAGGQDYVDVLGSSSGICTFTNAQFFRKTRVTLAHATATGCLFEDCENILFDANTAITSATIRGASSTARGLEYSGVAADKSAITAEFSDNSGIDLTVGAGGAGTYTFTGLTISGGHTLNVWNPSTTNSVTVELASGVTSQAIDLWFDYDTEASGPFTEGETLTFGNGATATLVVLQDNGTTGTMYCELLTGTAPPDNNSITGGTSSATANVNEASGANSSSLTISQPVQTFTINSDTASTLIRYFEDDSQTVVDSATGTTLDYEYPDTDPIDIELVKQNYVPVNRQNVTPSESDYDVIMDYDEAYNSSHGLTITTEYDYTRATKVLTINSDQNALDVRSALADVIRTNSSYYNTPLLMDAIPGLTRIDLTDGMTITSMATWKGAGMERFDTADSSNPVEKWFCIQSVGAITGATTHYRQTDSGDSTAVTLTSNVVDEAFQYWSDPNHDGSTADGYDYSDYMVIKSFLAGSKQGRVDVLSNAGLSALKSNLYTVPLSNESHGYSGSDPGISADITLIAGGTVGGKTFAYEIVDGGTNTGEDIADQLNYNAANNPNTVVPGGTGLRYFELPDMVIHNATSVETEYGYREGTTPTLVGFYVSRSSADHPDFTRFQADDGTYYTPATVAQISAPNLTAGRIQVINETGRTSSAWAATTAYNLYDKVLRSTGVGTESGIGLYFQCTTAGTTSGSEPTWDTTPGNTTADGTVTWTCRAIEFDNATTTSGYSNTWTDHEDFDSGDTIRMRWVDEDDMEISAEGVATADGTTSFLNTPVADSVYTTYSIDGSTVTEYSADFPNVEVDVNDPDNLFYLDRFYAWWKYNLQTADGIRNFFGGVTATNASNLTINDSVVDIFFDNVKSTSARQGDSIVVQRDDGVYPQADPTSGGGGLGFYYAGIGYTAETGVSGLTAGESAKLDTISSVDSNVDSIKTKTDQLTFTQANQIDSNVQYVNNVEVTGTGADGDEWGP